MSSQCGTCKCRLRDDSHTAVHNCGAPSYIRHDLDKTLKSYVYIEGIVSASLCNVGSPMSFFFRVQYTGVIVIS